MALFHRLAGLSIALCAATAAVAATAPAKSVYYGRWTISEPSPRYTARGREYKAIDIAPCGKDFCGVSVTDGGKCGATLFRFLGHRAAGNEPDSLRGHGKWGAARKNVVIHTYAADETPASRTIELYLGDGYDFGERSENMPRFHGEYRRSGVARCTAR
jgi:hypothetical protein